MTLPKLAADNGFEKLSLYLYDISGVDELATFDFEPDLPDKLTPPPSRLTSTSAVASAEGVDEQEHGPEKAKRSTAGYPSGFTVLEEDEESVSSGQNKRSGSLKPTGSAAEVRCSQ